MTNHYRFDIRVTPQAIRGKLVLILDRLHIVPNRKVKEIDMVLAFWCVHAAYVSLT